MNDEASIHLLTSIVQQIRGVTAVAVDPPAKLATISYEPSMTGPRDILDAIRTAGFPGAVLSSKNRKQENHVDEIQQ